ncbi:hypothetical protein RHGRI_011930 [Rhododendron griersonianum]|uniref:Uncharacterized protein n=1 Tax=Rhododendron griersonianum TaxID=479676 RepID=A0AAV6KPY9_9ERIC|nr:hypothetical protein RHGRI_011930 [Rhododendron griersonianum]
MLVPFRNPTPAHDNDVTFVRRQLAVVVPTTSSIVADSDSFLRFKLPRGSYVTIFCMYVYSSVHNFL